MANSGEENMLDHLETANINQYNLALERNHLQQFYNVLKETSVIRNKHVEDLRIHCQDQKNKINDLLIQEEQYSLLENEYSSLLKENKELKDKLAEAEKEREDSLNLQRQKDTFEREHKKKVEELQTNISIVENFYTYINESHEMTVEEFKKKLNRLEETEKKLTDQVNMFKSVDVLTNYYEGPKYKEYQAVLADIISKYICCEIVPRCKVTGKVLFDLYVKIARIFGEIESELNFVQHPFQVDENPLQELQRKNT